MPPRRRPEGWDRGISPYPQGGVNFDENPDWDEPGYQPKGPSEDHLMPQEQPRRLLDAHDNNIGRQALVTANVPAAIGDLGRGHEVILADLTGASRLGQVVTVVFTAYDPRNFLDGATLAAEPGVPVGIVRFGNGAGLAEVEIDIPSPHSHANGVPYGVSGTAISVPAGSLRVLARDDGRVIPGTGQGALVPDGTAGGQLVSAHVVYGDRGSPGRVYRTLFFGIDPGLLAGQSVSLRVPAFARSVTFYRVSKVVMSVLFEMAWTAAGGPFILDEIELASGFDSPTFPIPPRCTQLTITNDDILPIVSGMAVFEIGL